MTLQERKRYYGNDYEDFGLPEGISAIDFFDDELLDLLVNDKYSMVKIEEKDYLELLNDDRRFSKAAVLLLNFNQSAVGSKSFYQLLSQSNHLFNIVCNMIRTNGYGNSKLVSLLRNKDSLDLLKPLIPENQAFFVRVLSLLTSRELVEFLSDPVWRDMYKYVDLSTYLSAVNRLGVDAVGLDNLMEKLDGLDYNQTLEVLERNYNIETGEPLYLRDIYKEYEDEYRKYKIGKILGGLGVHSKEDTISKAKDLVNTEIGMEVLLSSFTKESFENVVMFLNLDPRLSELRKNKLLEILNNYEEYSIDTVKNIFSLYYFEDVSNNVRINLNVILNYANKDEKARELLGDKYDEYLAVFNYLSGKEQSNPLQIVSSINQNSINDLLSSMYVLFNQRVNDLISPEITLKNSQILDKDGITVQHIDNQNNCMFLIHSVSSYDENSYEHYMNQSTSSGKICMSLLDAQHTKTFLGGVVFGYDNVDAKLYTATVSDGQTNQRTSLLRQFGSDLLPINEFMARTDTYNELAYLTGNNLVKPSYVLCVDREPNEADMMAARDFGIPIYVYYRRKDLSEVPFIPTEHECYDYETSHIEIVPKRFVKEENLDIQKGV